MNLENYPRFVPNLREVKDYFYNNDSRELGDYKKTFSFAGLNSPSDIDGITSDHHDAVLAYRYGLNNDSSDASPEEQAEAFIKFHKDLQKRDSLTIGKWFTRNPNLTNGTVISFNEIVHRPFTSSGNINEDSVEVLILKELSFTIDSS
ncbi:MAG: hypothetical protein QNJ31_00245 [Candidatus Caenarcaniphilales bacterium]|nr:hypothetical protein [Candidatus Caenarcaniphilales bacterium]